MKCNVTYILQNRKNSGIIDILGITRVECKVVYNKFEVIRTFGVPAPTTVVLDIELPILTNCFRSFKKSSDHTITCSGILLLINLFNNTLWSMTSNALLKCKNHHSVAR